MEYALKNKNKKKSQILIISLRLFLKVTNKCYVQARRTGTPTLPEVSLHCFSFTHCTKQKLRHYRQASSKLSIQQKHLSTGTHDSFVFFFQDFYVLYIFRLQITNDFLLTTLFRKSEGGFSATVTYSNRLSVMWRKLVSAAAPAAPSVCAATLGALLLGAESKNAKGKSRWGGVGGGTKGS